MSNNADEADSEKVASLIGDLPTTEELQSIKIEVADFEKVTSASV